MRDEHAKQLYEKLEKTMSQTVEIVDEQLADENVDESGALDLGEEHEESDDLRLDLGESEEEDELTDEQKPRDLSDVKDLVKEGKTDEALKRFDEVEKGFEKTYAKVTALEGEVQYAKDYFANEEGLFNAIQQDSPEAITALEAFLLERTGWDFDSLAKFVENNDTKAKPGQAVTRQPAKPADDPKQSALEARLAKIENERASVKWIEEKGNPTVARLEEKTGMKFSAELLWRSSDAIAKFAKEGGRGRQANFDDILDGIAQTDPRAYRKQLEASSGDKKPVPKAATSLKGRTGGQKVEPPKNALEAAQRFKENQARLAEAFKA